MHKIIIITLLLFVILILGTTVAVAQECTEVVVNALDMATQYCEGLGRNEACYGNELVSTQLAQDARPFQEPGSTNPLDKITGMTLSPLDIAAQIWGVVLMNLQANIPDTVPGQNVQIIMFGNVQLQEIESGAFRFQSGIGNAQCIAAPDSGIMIRTPEGMAEITLNINEVNISLASTAYLEANPVDGMDITMFDGKTNVTAFNVTQNAEFSQTVNIPMNLVGRNLVPSGPPFPAQPWDAEKVSRVFVVYNALNSLYTGGSAPVNAEPCTVYTDRSFSAGLRVGPGTNRTRRAWLETNNIVDVTGKKTNRDGRLWWQLDKFQAFPKGANSVLELWVAEDQVIEQGACDQVFDVDAPPIIAPPPAPVLPTATPHQGSVPVVTEEAQPGQPSANVYISAVIPGSQYFSCGTVVPLNIHIENVQSAQIVHPEGRTSISTQNGDYLYQFTMHEDHNFYVTFRDLNGAQGNSNVFTVQTDCY